MNQEITVIVNGQERKYQEGTSFEEIAKDFQAAYANPIAIAKFNGKICELFKKPTVDGELEFLDLSDSVGHRSYVRTALLVMQKAIEDVIGVRDIDKVKVEFSIGRGYYCTAKGHFEVNDENLSKITERMNELIRNKTRITKRSYPMTEAVALFAAQGMHDKEKLCRFRKSSVINVYEIDGYYDYYYGYMLPNAGYITHFELLPYHDGIILNLPSAKKPQQLTVFEPREKLFSTLMTTSDWGDKLGIGTVGDLNECICNGAANDMILVQEALQERRIAEIANAIVEKKGIKFVMIAGPSSSGKTTFSHRLSIQLRTHGLHPHPIAVDDYFVNREDTPLDENGDYNFECLGAIDVPLFNKDMSDLLAGKTVELPTFNFKTGQREYHGNRKTLGADDVLVIEGIHALNDKMSASLPTESKFKIYISALTTLNIDEHNRIPTTDGRLLRRMVRDARTRGASAKRTIQMWPSVRRGEEENIFPFQESADAMFNSTLIYELAVLKPFAEPLLYSIGEDEPEYLEAKRLLKFLEYFLSVDTESLPKNSIAREFVGGSCFRV